MIKLWLGMRRLWWFFSDWTSVCRFTWPCPHCGDRIEFHAAGFRMPEHTPHINPVCKYRQIINHGKFRWSCIQCLVVAWTIWRAFVMCRWRFRKSWNWGIGIHWACKDGRHDFGDKPFATYEDYTHEFLIAKCCRCGYQHRLEIAK